MQTIDLWLSSETNKICHQTIFKRCQGTRYLLVIGDAQLAGAAEGGGAVGVDLHLAFFFVSSNLSLSLISV